MSFHVGRTYHAIVESSFDVMVNRGCYWFLFRKTWLNVFCFRGILKMYLSSKGFNAVLSKIYVYCLCTFILFLKPSFQVVFIYFLFTLTNFRQSRPYLVCVPASQPHAPFQCFLFWLSLHGLLCSHQHWAGGRGENVYCNAVSRWSKHFGRDCSLGLLTGVVCGWPTLMPWKIVLLTKSCRDICPRLMLEPLEIYTGEKVFIFEGRFVAISLCQIKQRTNNSESMDKFPFTVKSC